MNCFSSSPFFLVCVYVCVGAVLVFLPGLAEIKQLYEQLQANRMFNNRRAKKYVYIQISFFSVAHSVI